MKNIKLFTAILLVLLTNGAYAIDVVEIPMPKSNKVVIQLQFRNGSIADPREKKDWTYLTAQMITEGGTATMSREQITDKT
jgi:zinc protease